MSRRYIRRRAYPVKRPPRQRRYLKKWLDVSSVNFVAFPKIDRRLKRGERLNAGIVLGRFGDPKFIHVSKVRGDRKPRTVSVWDITFKCSRDGSCEFASLELKGLRGWDPGEPEKVNLPRSFDFVKYEKRRKGYKRRVRKKNSE